MKNVTFNQTAKHVSTNSRSVAYYDMSIIDSSTKPAFIDCNLDILVPTFLGREQEVQNRGET